jgi:excisionase family DNA binding protein
MSDQESDQTDNQPNLKALITFGEAARISGFTDRHLRNLASKKQLWAIKLGRNWFTTEQAVKEYLAKTRKPGPKSKKGQ